MTVPMVYNTPIMLANVSVLHLSGPGHCDGLRLDSTQSGSPSIDDITNSINQFVFKLKYRWLHRFSQETQFAWLRLPGVPTPAFRDQCDSARSAWCAAAHRHVIRAF